MEQVSRVESIITLQELLKASPPPLYTPSFFGQDTIDPFIKKRNELTETVNARAKINIQTICTQLDSLSTNDLTKDLVDLIKEMLSISNVLLHEHVPKLLHKLADISAVQTIIDHLGEQPTNPRPIRPHRGSFDAVPALSDKHQTCLDLLRNNSKTFNDANNNCCQANNFLQNFLSIYQEIHTHPSEPLPEQKDKASCIIQ